ncbi:NDP-sugar synthase [archaeon]|nr:NDP-sugar synthase [archaeon]
MDCVILAGGKGSRMEDPLPKAMIEAGGKAIIMHQLEYLVNKADDIVISLGYKSEEVIKYVEENFKSSSIKYVVETEPLGTAGGLKLALQKTKSDLVLVLNCDDIADIDLKKLEEYNDNTICVAHPRLPFGLVNSYCGYAEFLEKPLLNCWTSCGWYLLKREAINELPDKGSIEYDIFQTRKIKMRVYEHEGFWSALNTKKDIEEFEKNLNNRTKKDQL